MKGVFDLNPPKPRSTDICDINIMFLYYKTHCQNVSLIWKDLTEKLTILITLLQGQSCKL